MPDDNSTVRDESPKPESSPADRESSSGAATPVRVPVEFPPTRWSLVLEAAQGDEAKSQEALTELCEHYRPAIQSYFRMKCRDLHLAQDLASSFVLHLLEKNRFRKFTRRENMRFRNYLSRALKYFLYDHPPEPPSEPVETYLATAGVDAKLENHIDAQLALAMHDRSMSALEESYGKHGKAERMARLRGFILEDPEGDEYPRAATDLGLTVNAIYQAVFRMRNDYYERFRAEVAQTVRHCKEELDEETRYLMGLVPSALAEQR